MSAAEDEAIDAVKKSIKELMAHAAGTVFCMRGFEGSRSGLKG